ncbi:HK97 family phage prohead protease [Lacticaseibacillus sp. N501-2]|uniref:HK97 family phage prohead protease n=1 Tax=Lacticaseibacillus salsurae TaxID=3367729 RepID=UPI0038B4169C
MTTKVKTATQRMAMTPKAEFRVAGEEDGKKYLEGYFIRFNEETELWPGYFEQIAPESIDDSINSQDIRALFDHDTAKVLGRTTNNTLELRKDEQGVYGKVLVNEDDPEALSIYAKVKRGDVSSASFGFYIDDDEMNQPGDGTYHDTIRSLTLLEVSVVTFPAYPTTEIDARKRDVKHLQQEQFEHRKSQLIKELEEKWQIQS